MVDVNEELKFLCKLKNIGGGGASDQGGGGGVGWAGGGGGVRVDVNEELNFL